MGKKISGLIIHNPKVIREPGADEFSRIGEDEHAVVDRVGDEDFSPVPHEAARTLELSFAGAGAAEFAQPFALAGEDLHAIVSSVFADVEVLRGVLADADRVDECAVPLAVPPKRLEHVPLLIEPQQLRLSMLQHHARLSSLRLR